MYPICYGLLGKAFGLEYHSPLLFHAGVVTAALAVFVLVVKPSSGEADLSKKPKLSNVSYQPADPNGKITVSFDVTTSRFERTGTAVKDAWRGSRRACFDGAPFDCPIYERERLDVGSSMSGPAVLEQLDCTTVIRPGQVARVDEWKNLIVTQEN